MGCIEYDLQLHETLFIWCGIFDDAGAKKEDLPQLLIQSFMYQHSIFDHSGLDHSINIFVERQEAVDGESSTICGLSCLHPTQWRH